MTLKSVLFRKKWDLAFVKGGLETVFSDKPYEFDVVKNPYKDRWFADPFVLDVTDDKIFLLAEEYRYSHCKGRIAKLVIDRNTMTIEKFVIILECPTHLSFPNILRRDGKIYVYPESAESKKLDIYEYDREKEKLIFVKTICDEAVWDSSMTDLLGGWKLFTSSDTDDCLDVYDWDQEKELFVHSQVLKSDRLDNRMAGQLFKYKGDIYCPTQGCTKTYGDEVCLKRLINQNGTLQLISEKKLVPPEDSNWEGLHTLNEYKGVVVIDLKGWVYPKAQSVYNFFSKWKKKK